MKDPKQQFDALYIPVWLYLAGFMALLFGWGLEGVKWLRTAEWHPLRGWMVFPGHVVWGLYVKDGRYDGLRLIARWLINMPLASSVPLVLITLAVVSQFILTSQPYEPRARR